MTPGSRHMTTDKRLTTKELALKAIEGLPMTQH
jgi:hypothetical protein